jgi:hypothetical protein
MIGRYFAALAACASLVCAVIGPGASWWSHVRRLAAAEMERPRGLPNQFQQTLYPSLPRTGFKSAQ